MQYRRIGDSDLEMSVITFGAWAAGGWMWGGTEPRKSVDAIRASYDLGVTSIDTAPAYGQGLSEEIVGEALQNIPREKIQIATKFGVRWDTSKGTFAFKSKDNSGKDIDIYRYSGGKDILRECEDSLRRLRTDYIDLYQIHWPDATTPMAESMEAVASLIQAGKVRHAGVSNFTAAQMEEAEKSVHIISNQVPFSMVKRDIEKETVPYCIRANKAILAYSPLERGLLTGKMKPGYKFQENDHRATLYFFSDENIQRTNAFLQKIKGIADSKNVTLAQLVLRWTIERPGMTIALAGARDAKQAVENANAVDLILTSDEKSLIDKELQTLELVKP